MPLVPCKECGVEISTNAQTCPHCGTPYPAKVNGSVTFLRVSSLTGKMLKMNLFINNKFMCALEQEDKYIIDLEPGKYVIIAGLTSFSTKSKPYSLSVKAGIQYLVELSPEVGLFIGGTKIKVTEFQ